MLYISGTRENNVIRAIKALENASFQEISHINEDVLHALVYFNIILYIEKSKIITTWNVIQ